MEIENKMMLSPNFALREFRCGCGCTFSDVVVANLRTLCREVLEPIRAGMRDRRMTITSGYRCRSYNRAIGGATESRHIYADAADCKIHRRRSRGFLNGRYMAGYVAAMQDFEEIPMGGAAWYRGYPDMFHVDSRGVRRRWVG